MIWTFPAMNNCNTFSCVAIIHGRYWDVQEPDFKKSLNQADNSEFRVEFTQSACLVYRYTWCPKRNVKYFGRVFLMLNYTDITQNTYVQSWTVTEIMAREKCGRLPFPFTVRLQLCSALTLTEQCSTHLCDSTSSAQRDKIVFHYCRYSCAMYSAW